MAASAPTGEPESRVPRGEWRPSYPIHYAPLFTWPPKPLALLRWFLNYPGFMWPRNLLLLLISTVSWFYTQPALARCAQFQWDWLAQIYLRNIALTWLVYGGYYFFLYFECNYDEATLPFDRWFGTFRDGLPDGAGSRLPGEHQDSPRGSALQTSP